MNEDEKELAETAKRIAEEFGHSLSGFVKLEDNNYSATCTNCKKTVSIYDNVLDAGSISAKCTENIELTLLRDIFLSIDNEDYDDYARKGHRAYSTCYLNSESSIDTCNVSGEDNEILNYICRDCGLTVTVTKDHNPERKWRLSGDAMQSKCTIENIDSINETFCANPITPKYPKVFEEVKALYRIGHVLRDPTEEENFGGGGLYICDRCGMHIIVHKKKITVNNNSGSLYEALANPCPNQWSDKNESNR